MGEEKVGEESKRSKACSTPLILHPSPALASSYFTKLNSGNRGSPFFSASDLLVFEKI